MQNENMPIEYECMKCPTGPVGNPSPNVPFLIRTDNVDDLVNAAQAHFKHHHHAEISREEILRYAWRLEKYEQTHRQIEAEAK